MLALLIFAAQPLDPVEQYEQKFEQKTTPPVFYTPQKPKPPINFNRPFGSGITPPAPERRYIDQNGKLITCRNTGPWIYCF